MKVELSVDIKDFDVSLEVLELGSISVELLSLCVLCYATVVIELELELN